MTTPNQSATPDTIDVWELPRDFDPSTGVGRTVEGIEFKWLDGQAVPLGAIALTGIETQV